jgi:hypothetical protein
MYVRGIILNYHVSHLVHFEVIKDMILVHGVPTVSVHTERKIKPKRKVGERYRYFQNTMTRHTEFPTSRGGEWKTIRPSHSGVNRGGFPGR